MSRDYLDKQIAENARIFFNRLKEDPGVCSWCFYRNHEVDVDEAEREAYYLLLRNRAAFCSRGHRLVDDGTVEVNRGARMSRSPGTTSSWIVETDEMGRQTGTARKTVICDGCGTIGRKEGMDRDNELLQSAARHLIDNVRDLTGVDEALEEDSAIEWVKQSKAEPDLQGQDEYVLTKAIYRAIEPVFTPHSLPGSP